MRVLVVLLAAFALLVQAREQWNVESVASTATNPQATFVMQPGVPVVVHPFIPPAPKVFNATKATPGAGCDTKSDCEACIGTHYCVWTSEAKCLRSTSRAARALIFEGKASNVCIKQDPFTKANVITSVRHTVAAARQARSLPTTVEEAVAQRGVVPPVVIGDVPVYVNAEARVVLPVNKNNYVAPIPNIIAKGTAVFTNNATVLAPVAAPASSPNVNYTKAL